MLKDILNKEPKNILFLGTQKHFTQDEINKFLNKEGHSAYFKYENQDIDFIILSSIISPYEEELSYELYEKGIKDYKLEEFEEYFVSKLKPNSLIMALKLSNNQERLRRLLQSKAFDNQTYLKLFKLYNWGEDDVFDSDSNRDVALSFINRFFEKREHYNHTDIAHSPATLIDIALSLTNSDALEAMLKIPNFSVKSRAQEPWKPKNLREFIALNPNLNSTTIDYLLSLRDSRLDALLCLNSAINLKEQELIYSRANNTTLTLLAQNQNLDFEIFKKLLSKDLEIVKTLLSSQKITKKELKLLEESYIQFLANNTQISEVKDELLGINKELDLLLISNPIYNENDIKNIYQKYQNEAIEAITKNPNTPTNMLEEFYKTATKEILLNIASNPNTPSYILEEIYNQNQKELNQALAKNCSLPNEFIEFFKLDNELLNIMSQNDTLREKIAKKRVI